MHEFYVNSRRNRKYLFIILINIKKRKIMKGERARAEGTALIGEWRRWKEVV